MIVLQGATSQIGYFLLRRLASRHIPVLAVSRHAPPSWGVTRDACWMQYDLDQNPMPSDAGALIAAGALRHTVAAVNAMPRLTQVIAVSSQSVVTKQASQHAPEQAVVSELLQAESELQQLCAKRDIILTVLRPTMIYGCGLDQNVSRIAAWLRRRSWLPLAYPARGLRQPVHADDLAALCIQCLELGEAAAGCFDVGGGSRMTYRDMVERIAAALQRPLRCINLPVGLLAPTLDLVSGLTMFKGLNGAMVRRQNIDLVVDDSAARERLCWMPRPFEPDASCFIPPARRADG